MKILKGNTQKGVNKEIIEYLNRQQKDGLSLLDVPCGEGDFLLNLRQRYPSWKLRGIDLYAKPRPEVKDIIEKAPVEESFSGGEKYDVITSISGVMVYDNLNFFFSQASKSLHPRGCLIVTNDNVLTVRDRLSFLFTGRLKRFKLFYSAQEGNWNLVLPQGLWKLLKSNNFDIEKIKYTSFYWEDYLFFPIAAVLYPFLLLNIFLGKGEMPQLERNKLFPFACLLARHYIIYARPRS